jgi:hypothetical protein
MIGAAKPTKASLNWNAAVWLAHHRERAEPELSTELLRLEAGNVRAAGTDEGRQQKSLMRLSFLGSPTWMRAIGEEDRMRLRYLMSAVICVNLTGCGLALQLFGSDLIAHEKEVVDCTVKGEPAHVQR